MASYEFITIWRVEAPIEKVWGEIYCSEHWPQWWKEVEQVVELKKGDDLGVGNTPGGLSFPISLFLISKQCE